MYLDDYNTININDKLIKKLKSYNSYDRIIFVLYMTYFKNI